jgi:hypothetical protein
MSAIAYANLESQMMTRAGGMNAAVIHGEGLDKSSALNPSGRIAELDGLPGLFFNRMESFVADRV